MRQAQIAREPRQSKVGNPKRPLRVDQQVGWFDVTMQNAKSMRVVKGFRCLYAKTRDVTAKNSIQMSWPTCRGQHERAAGLGRARVWSQHRVSTTAAARFESAILGPDTSAEGEPQARTLLAEEVAFSVYSSPEATACSPASTRLSSLPWRSS